MITIKYKMSANSWSALSGAPVWYKLVSCKRNFRI